LDPGNNELFVSNNGNTVTVYRRTASGNAPPVRMISGEATGLLGPTGIAVSN
jgi:hypothetical protein